MAKIIGVRFRHAGKAYYFDPSGFDIKYNDAVIVETARGIEYGRVIMAPMNYADEKLKAPLKGVLRIATAEDTAREMSNREKEKEAFRICKEKILEHGLDMKLIATEYAFDDSKILFYFTADGRIDFRELVKDLAGAFHTRIELRQIGVRDKAKLVGGLGICGRPFCCGEFLEDFQPVSIKMAKTQNLSLNPTKISGTCGRLMCCLKYEQDTYESLIRSSPKAESFVDTPEGRGTVTDVDVLRQRVKVRMEDNPDTVSVFSVEDIAVLRSGKAKKNDPPIPADLAPISGSGKRARKEPEPVAPMLESIRFRYSTEEVAREVTAPAAAEEPRSRRRKNRGENRPARDPKEGKETREPKEPQAAKEPATQPKTAKEPAAQPTAPVPDGEGEKKPRRRPNYRHRRRPKAPQA